MNLRLIPAAAALLLALAACGGDPATGSTATQTSPGGQSSAGAGTAQDAQLKFAQCMRENGIDVPDPKDGRIMMKIPEGVPKEKVEKAQKECEKFMQGAVGDKGKAADSAERDKMVKFAECMRENGVDVPDPEANGGIKIEMGPGDQDKFEKAQEACKEFAPGFGKSTP
ncbi:hypothetical protein OIE66_42880 [Nonomuraea sp. NBC_01738]|uniref:hypothetical protein n=1 Tax=Nonomuraea sp. NBC_01738 TaxID=2976003 RepID=UPI002E11AEF9|nr:hypothetical protein OIE66_42880 [Nonomuraea sp. NBC_01738]